MEVNANDFKVSFRVLSQTKQPESIVPHEKLESKPQGIAAGIGRAPIDEKQAVTSHITDYGGLMTASIHSGTELHNQTANCRHKLSSQIIESNIVKNYRVCSSPMGNQSVHGQQGGKG
jgi:hypothetical protein